MSVYCLYHNDADGKCAAAIVGVKHPKKITNFIPIDNISLSSPPQLKKFGHSDTVIIVDISLSYDAFQRLLGTVGKIIWIDHHKTSLEVLHQIGHDLVGKLDDVTIVHRINEGGACLLTWKYYEDDLQVPQIVSLISNYDEWKYNYGDDVMLFNLGFSTMVCEPDSPWWGFFLNAPEHHAYDEVQRLISKGIPILHYQEIRAMDLMENYSFELNFEGIDFLAINTDTHNIALRKMGHTHDGMLLFSKQSSRWVVSLYSSKDSIDVSSIAKKYGGGGHRAAAGFSIDTLPF